MRMQNLGCNVFVAVGPLVQMAGRTHAEAAQAHPSELQNAVLGQAERRLRIARKFVVAPPCGVGTGFVQKARREDMVPDDREGIVDLGVIEEVITVSAVVVGQGRRLPVNRKADVIFAGHVGVETSVVLLEVAAGGIADGVLGDIGSGRESAADAGIAGADVAEILRAEAGRERRTDVQALPRDGCAVYALSQSGIRAGRRANQRAENGCSLGKFR